MKKKTETKARVNAKLPTSPNPKLDVEEVITIRELPSPSIPNPNPNSSSHAVSTGNRKRGLPSSSTRYPNPNLNPSYVVSAHNVDVEAILRRRRKRKLTSSSTSTINLETQETQSVSSSSTSSVDSPSLVSASNPDPEIKLNLPSSSVLKKNTCATARYSNTSPRPKDKHEVRIIRDETPSPITKEKQKTRSFTCQLCCWSRNDGDRFNIKGCGHFYCRDCIEKYVSSKLENNVVVIGCPALGCGSKLELELCQEVLSRAVLDRWGDALCESLIQASQKFYCPFKDCSALLVNDGGEVVMESECPNCRRLFCARCKVPWHAEIKCEEFQRFNKEEQNDVKMKALAEEEKWARCPTCNFYVQKISGCNFVKCRCGTLFCYLCGKTAMVDHYCAYCRR